MSTDTATAAASPTPALRSGRLTFGLWGLVGLGIVTFLIGIAGEHAQRAWQAYLVNWLFWSGAGSQWADLYGPPSNHKS